MSPDLLVSGGVLVAMDAARRVIADGAVAVAAGRILAVGPRAAVEAAHPGAARRIDARGKAILPGLIDAHAHAGHGLVKSLGSGDGAAWMEACRILYTLASPPAFWAAEARLAGLERLMCGVTTGVSLLGGGDSVHRVDDPAHGEARAAAIAEVGIRDVMAVGPSRSAHPYRGLDGTVAQVSLEHQIEVCGLLLERLHGRGLQRLCALLPVYRETAHDADLVREVEARGRAMLGLAGRFGVPLHQDGHRTGSIELAERMFGLLSPRTFLSHCTDLTDADVESLARTGAHVVHNPTALAAVRGFCPVVRLLEAGVNVCLGSDATAPDRSGDMFRHMFEAMRYAQRAARDDALLPPGRALEMATVDAARALGMSDEIGSLEPGKRADLITVDLTAPHMAPANMPVTRLVCFATGADVRDVVVDGRVLMEGRCVPHLDRAAIVAEAEARASEALAVAGLAHLAVEEPGWGRIRR